MSSDFDGGSGAPRFRPQSDRVRAANVEAAISVIRAGVGLTAVGLLAFPMLFAGPLHYVFGFAWFDGWAVYLLWSWLMSAVVDATDGQNPSVALISRRRTRELYDWALGALGSDAPWYAISRQRMGQIVRVAYALSAGWLTHRLVDWSLVQDWAWVTAPW